LTTARRCRSSRSKCSCRGTNEGARLRACLGSHGAARRRRCVLPPVLPQSSSQRAPSALSRPDRSFRPAGGFLPPLAVQLDQASGHRHGYARRCLLMEQAPPRIPTDYDAGPGADTCRVGPIPACARVEASAAAQNLGRSYRKSGPPTALRFRCHARPRGGGAWSRCRRQTRLELHALPRPALPMTTTTIPENMFFE